MRKRWKKAVAIINIAAVLCGSISTGAAEIELPDVEELLVQDEIEWPEEDIAGDYSFEDLPDLQENGLERLDEEMVFGDDDFADDQFLEGISYEEGLADLSYEQTDVISDADLSDSVESDMPEDAFLLEDEAIEELALNEEIPEERSEEFIEESMDETIEEGMTEEPEKLACGQFLTWEIRDGILLICGEGEMYDYSEEAPAPWAEDRSTIRSVELENGVTVIGENAFLDCIVLETVKLPQTLVKIRSNAFCGCDNLCEEAKTLISSYDTEESTELLENVEQETEELDEQETWEETVDMEEEDAAETVEPETDLELENTEESMEEEVFFDFPAEGTGSESIPGEPLDDLSGFNLESNRMGMDDLSMDIEEEQIDVEQAEKKLEAPTGNTCGKTAYWDYKDGVLTISGTGVTDDYTDEVLPGWHEYHMAIREIVVSAGITGLGQYLFNNCWNVEKITLPQTLTSIGRGTFYECNGLASIDIPASVTTIPDGAFANCTSLEKITMPGVTTVMDYAFQNTSIKNFLISKRLTNLGSMALFGADVQAFEVDNGNPVYASDNGVLFTADRKTLLNYPCAKEGSTYNIPATVIKIGDGAFCRNNTLNSIFIPEGVTTLGDSAFQQVENLQNISLPNSITSTGDYAFYNCPNLKSVRFGTGMKTTSYMMFEKCISLEKIDFGGLQEVGLRAFAGCTSLKEIILPESIKEILNGAFGECTGLEKVTMKGVKVIAYQAFFDDTSLTSVTLNEGLTTIYTQAFYGCTSLKKVVLPKSVTEVTTEAFPETTQIVNQNSDIDSYGSNGYMVLERLNITGTRNYNLAYEVMNLVNTERSKKGLKALAMDKSLLESAMQRAGELTVLYSHTRPDGTICTSINRKMTAENIAYGQASPQEVMKSWMSSEGHKANILDENNQAIGVGCFELEECLYWVQCFGIDEAEYAGNKPANKEVTQAVNMRTGEFNEGQVPGAFAFSSEQTKYSYVITLDGPSTMVEGEKAQFTAYLRASWRDIDTKLTGSNVVFESSNPKIATVSEKGVVTAVKSGNVNITAKTPKGRFSGTVQVKVTKKDAADKPVQENIKKKKNKITARNITMVRSSKIQKKKINATNRYNQKMIFKSSSRKVKVDASGKITVAKNYIGTAKITIKTAATKKIAAASAVITVTVKPAAPKVTSAKRANKTVAEIKWKKVSKAAGYQIQYAANKKMSKAKTLTVAKNKASAKLKKISSKKVLYVRIRSWQKSNGKKVYSKWSSIKKIKFR